MRTSTLFLVPAISLALAASAAWAAPTLDAKGKCRDHGKFVAASQCKPPAPKQQCKDAKGKFAKCGTPGATAITK